jgi:hypothetical protein
MGTATYLSPNTGNYQVGKGIVSFKKNGDADYRDLGNVSVMTITPDVTTLDHFSSRTGVKSKDLSIIVEKKATLKITADEITAYNVGLLTSGAVDESAVGGPTVDYMSQSSVQGALRFVGSNDQGAKITMDVFNVSFTPQGDLNLISDEWNELEMEADVLVATEAPNIGKFALIQFTDVTPAS